MTCTEKSTIVDRSAKVHDWTLNAPISTIRARIWSDVVRSHSGIWVVQVVSPIPPLLLVVKGATGIPPLVGVGAGGKRLDLGDGEVERIITDDNGLQVPTMCDVQSKIRSSDIEQRKT